MAVGGVVQVRGKKSIGAGQQAGGGLLQGGDFALLAGNAREDSGDFFRQEEIFCSGIVKHGFQGVGVQQTLAPYLQLCWHCLVQALHYPVWKLAEAAAKLSLE